MIHNIPDTFNASVERQPKCKLLYTVYILAIVFCFFIQHSNGYAQSPRRFLTYSVKDGLSQSSVHAIHRDKDGQVWIGTQDGLNSFDGKLFETFRCNENDETSISDQFVLSIKEEPGGNLWIGTRNGLNYFNKKTRKFKRYYINAAEKKQFQSEYSTFFVINNDSVLIEKGGLYLLMVHENKFIKIRNPSIFGGRWIIGDDHRAWFIDSLNYLYEFKDWRKPDFERKGKSAVTFNPYFNYCLAGDTSIYIYNLPDAKVLYELNTRNFYPKNKFSLQAAINHVDVAKDGSVNISTGAGVLLKSKSGETEVISGKGEESGFPLGAVLTSYKDMSGNVWFGMAGSGLTVNNNAFNNFRLINSPLKNDRVISLAGDKNYIYVASHSGLYKLKKTLLLNRNEKFESVISGKSIVAVTTDKDDNIWAADNKGNVYVGKKPGLIIKRYFYDSIINIGVLNLFTSNKGDVFICTNRGLYIKKAGVDSLKAFTVKDNNILLGYYVLGVYEDHKGIFWISTNNGINVLNSNFKNILSFESSSDERSFIKRTIVTCVTQDLDSTYWIGTIRNGLYRYKNSKYEHYTHANGLASDVVNNIVCDNLNRVWVVTSSGLNIYNKNENSFDNFSEFDGVPDASFSFAAVLKEGNNIFYGTSQGILLCSANNVELKNNLIRAYISDIKINGKSTGVLNNEIEIIPDGKLIVFEAAFSPALLSGNIICQYRMSGLSEKWITLPVGVNSISYNGLPYKKLKFELRAAESINKLDEAEVYSVIIKSKPPFYKTYWFFGIIILLISLLIYRFLAIKNKRRFQKQLQLLEIDRKIQKERVRIGRDLHDNIGAYTSALIAGLNRVKTGNEKEQEKITDLKSYGSSIMVFLRETIWMLNAENLTVTAFADRFKNYALRISPNYPQIDFKFRENILNDKKLSPTIMLNLFRILQEALQNSCKHSNATMIEIIICSDDILKFNVNDNGVGFKEIQITEHYGLDNMRQRALEAEFELKIESDDTGTQISIFENTANVPL